MQQILLEWFKNNFVPDVRGHFKKIGLKDDSKILLLLDNCTAHPDANDFNTENVVNWKCNVKCFPPICTSFVQPMVGYTIYIPILKLVTTNNRK